jgi:hypothetical protein
LEYNFGDLDHEIIEGEQIQFMKEESTEDKTDETPKEEAESLVIPPATDENDAQ